MTFRCCLEEPCRACGCEERANSSQDRAPPPARDDRRANGPSPELIGSLKLGNVCVFLQLIFCPKWPMKELKNWDFLPALAITCLAIFTTSHFVADLNMEIADLSPTALLKEEEEGRKAEQTTEGLAFCRSVLLAAQQIVTVLDEMRERTGSPSYWFSRTVFE